MALNVTMYNNKSERNAVNKVLTQVASYNGNLRESADICNPSILIQAASIAGNYAFISALGNRYYFVTKVTAVNTNLWRVDLAVDVLKTYATAIKAQTAVIKRQQNNYNLYLDDSMFKVYNNQTIQTKTFSQGFTDTINYLLVVAGG